MSEAAQLAGDIGAKWLVPMHFEPGQENDFVTHSSASARISSSKCFR